jgi:hypothetical protein
MPALEPLISKFRRSRAPVAPVYFEQALRPLVGNRTLRGSVLSEPGARAARGSSLLGKGPGHLMPTVVAAVRRCGRAFSGVAWAGGRDCLPRPFGYRAVIIACMHACGHRGRGGSRSLVRNFYPKLMRTWGYKPNG